MCGKINAGEADEIRNSSSTYSAHHVRSLSRDYAQEDKDKVFLEPTDLTFQCNLLVCEYSFERYLQERGVDMGASQTSSRADCNPRFYRMMVEMGRDRYVVPSPQIIDIPLSNDHHVPLTRTVQWFADSVDRRHPSQVQFFFPILMIAQWEEFDLIGPSEWNIRALGPRKSFSNALAHHIAQVAPSFLHADPKEWFALLHVNRNLIGYDGILLAQFFFPARLVRLGVEGRVVSPLEWSYPLLG